MPRMCPLALYLLLFACALAAPSRGAIEAGEDRLASTLRLAGVLETPAVLNHLRALGVRSPADLAWLSDTELVEAGMSMVAARKAKGAPRTASHPPHSSPDPNVVLTFGDAGKAVSLLPGEHTLYSHACESSVCSLRHMWFGGDWAGYNVTRLKVYVDGELHIDARFFMLHGIGFGDDQAPWTAGSLFGKTGKPSGIFNTFQIPFGSAINITGQPYDTMDAPSTSAKRFWWIFRGVEALGATLGGVVLPPSARLQLAKNEAVPVKADANLTLLDTTRPGAVLMTVLSVQSAKEQFLEGEVRAFGPGAGPLRQLSSGTEDYFLGTYYFNAGRYYSGIAGLTHLDTNGPGGVTFSAYRVHDRDPVFYGAGGFGLNWRAGEFPTADVVASSYVLYYQW